MTSKGYGIDASELQNCPNEIPTVLIRRLHGDYAGDKKKNEQRRRVRNMEEAKRQSR
jgi:hypothetical protein